jgi:hypothetical protein
LRIGGILIEDFTMINEVIMSKKEIRCLEDLYASIVGNLGINPLIAMERKVGILRILDDYHVLTLFPNQGWVNHYNLEPHKAELLP